MPKSSVPFAIAVHDVKGKGRGVFATKDFKKGELIERCPVLIIPAKHSQHVLATKLDHYAFDWENDDLALVLGYGMIYNHSYAPNAKMIHNLGTRKSDILAFVPIKKGEEILINYNGTPKDMAPLWFDVVDHRHGE